MRTALPLLVLGCQPVRVGAVAVCQSSPPDGVVVREVVCADEVPAGGIGRSGADWLLANAQLRVIVRSPEQALTLHGVGGGTLLDAAPWGGSDLVHEVVPIVGGGWIDAESLEWTDAGIALTGPVRDLPDQPAWDYDAVRTVVLRLGPDDTTVSLAGANGLWIHPLAGVGVSRTGALQGPDATLGAAAAQVTDLGGALRLDGVGSLTLGGPTAWADLGVPTQEIDGTAAGATTLDLFAGDQRVGSLSLPRDGAFHLEIPADVDRIVASAPDRAPAEAAPGRGLQLAPGPAARLSVVPRFEGMGARPVPVQGAGPDGQSFETVIGSTGGAVWVSPGSWTLTIGALPGVAPAVIDLTVDADAIAAPTLRPTWDPHPYVLARLDLPADGDWRHRTGDAAALRSALGDGAAYAVLTPTDATATLDRDEAALPLHAAAGFRATHPDGWTLRAWPATANSKFAGWGAPDLSLGDAVDAMTVATGPASRRFTAVDLAWFEQVPPGAARFDPDLVALPSPGAAGPAAWQGWWRWLDGGRAVAPTGPFTWARVPDPARVAAAEIEGALVSGAVAAGTGPLLRLWWGDREAGDGPAAGALTAPMTAHLSGGEALTDLALIGDGGVVLAAWPLEGATTVTAQLARPPAMRWVVAVAWDAAGAAWAASAPLWLDPPG